MSELVLNVTGVITVFFLNARSDGILDFKDETSLSQFLLLLMV